MDVGVANLGDKVNGGRVNRIVGGNADRHVEDTTFTAIPLTMRLHEVTTIICFYTFIGCAGQTG